jgi:hypothetical protein
MATYNTTGSNGVSYGVIHTVTAQDATDDEVVLDFGNRVDLVATVTVLSATNATLESDLVITYPGKGQISIADGAVLKLTAGQKLNVVAQYARVV